MPFPKNAGKPFTRALDAQVRELHAAGASAEQIAERLGRTKAGITARLYRLGLATAAEACVPAAQRQTLGELLGEPLDDRAAGLNGCDPVLRGGTRPAEMSTPDLLAYIAELQQIQKSNRPAAPAWQAASQLLAPCFAEMARREPVVPPRYLMSTLGTYVIGFSDEHLCVILTRDARAARRFTAEQAEAFLAEYADAGYGLARADTFLTPIN